LVELAEEYKYIVRIAGTDLDGSLKVGYALGRVRGVGLRLGHTLLRAVKVDPDKRIGHLTDEEVRRVEEVLKEPAKYGIQGWLLNRKKDLDTGKDLHLVGPDLELRTKLDIEFMKDIRCWRGIRHSLGLKVRGQRTRTTGRTGRAVGIQKRVLLAKAREKRE